MVFLILKLSHHFKGLLLCLYFVVCIIEWLCNFFSGVLELLWIKIDWLFIFRSVSSTTVVVVVVVLIVSALFHCISPHLQLSSSTGMFPTMVLLIVMDSWLSGDDYWISFVCFDCFCCCRHYPRCCGLLLLPFLNATYSVLNHGIAFHLIRFAKCLLAVAWLFLSSSSHEWACPSHRCFLLLFIEPLFCYYYFPLLIHSIWFWLPFYFRTLVSLFSSIGLLWVMGSVSERNVGWLISGPSFHLSWSLLHSMMVLLTDNWMVWLANRACPFFIKNCSPKCRPFGTRPVSYFSIHLLDYPNDVADNGYLFFLTLYRKNALSYLLPVLSSALQASHLQYKHILSLSHPFLQRCVY
jgi:hypothetical protein